jgi:Arc/MetJ-type ribon-helix-helix transcriptional regulator
MVVGMATVKVTITLPEVQFQQIRNRVAGREASSVSGFIQQAVHQSLQNASEFRAMVDQVLEETGGPLTARERSWARQMLSPRKRGAKAGPRKAA